MGALHSGEHDELRRRFRQLPPEHVRWETEPGYQFRLMMAIERQQHTLAELATILDISISGARKIVERRIPAHRARFPWPSDAETDTLETAWYEAEQVRRITGRLSRAAPQFIRVQEILTPLLQRYQLRHLAAAIGTSPRALVRFIPTPPSKTSET